MRIFLTGATGLVGKRVADRLLARGDDLTILARTPAKARRLADAGATVVEGDLSDAAAIARGVEGAQAVIHAAADYRVGIPESERDAMFDANVRGTERVLDAAIAAGAERILHVSTGNVFGNTGDTVADERYERDPAAGFLSVYDETKYRAHQAALQRIESGAPIMIAQPGGIVGRGDTSQIANLIEQTRAGRMRLLMFPEFTLSYVHVDDLADGLLLVLDRGRLGETYVLGGDEADLRTFIGTVAELSGRRPPTRTMPPALIRAAAPMGAVVGPLMGFPPNMRELIRTSDGVRIRMTDAKARDELGYRTRTLREALSEVLERPA